MTANSRRRLIGVDDVAEILGGRSRWSVYDLARKGVIPHVRVGRSVLFDPDALDAWIARGGSRRPAADPDRDERRAS